VGDQVSSSIFSSFGKRTTGGHAWVNTWVLKELAKATRNATRAHGHTTESKTKA
jgi:hypothetical protein